MIKVKAKKNFYFFGRDIKEGENVQISRDDYDAWLKDELCFKVNDLDKEKIDDATVVEDKEPESAPEVSVAEDKKPKSKSKLKTEKVK